MHAVRFHSSSSRLQIFFRFYIILAWCFGLVIGLHIIPSRITGDNWSLKTAGPTQGSFAVLFLISILPFVLSIVFAKRKQTLFLVLMCFLKAILYGFCLSLIHNRFAAGAWLGRILFLLTDTVSTCILLWFFLCYGANYGSRAKKAAVFSFFVLLFVCSFDSFALTPFLHSLF